MRKIKIIQSTDRTYFDEYGICIPLFFHYTYWDGALPNRSFNIRNSGGCLKQDFLLVWCRILSNSRKSLMSLRKNNYFKSRVDSAMLAMVDR